MSRRAGNAALAARARDRANLKRDIAQADEECGFCAYPFGRGDRVLKSEAGRVYCGIFCGLSHETALREAENEGE
jgi:hypothetical protein